MTKFLYFCLVLLASQPLYGFKLKEAAVKGGRFKKFPVRFLIAQQSNTASIQDQSEIIAARNAFETWSHISGCKLHVELDSRFLFNGTCEDALNQNINVICFIPTKTEIQALAGLAALPEATIPVVGGVRNTDGGLFRGAFILINEEDFQFRTDTFDDSDESKYDLQAALTQGLAEVIGLTTSDAEKSVTQLINIEDSKKFRTLHEDDIRGAQFLYPALEALPGINCSANTIQPSFPLGPGLLLLLMVITMVKPRTHFKQKK